MEITATYYQAEPNPTMKNQLAKLLPVLALVLVAPAVTGIVNASPHQHGYGRMADMRMGRHMDDLNLTAAQKTKMEQLRQSARTQIEQILTPEQRQKFQQIESQHQARHQAGKGLNLTADQTAKMKAIYQANRAQFVAMLTPAQQAQLKPEGRSGEGRGEGHGMTRLNQLNLTSEQKTKLARLRASGRAQMEAILTPAQQQKAKAMQDRRNTVEDTWKSLNLTADQTAKIKAIRQASEDQFKAILTPAQQTKLKVGKHGRGHHHNQAV